MKRMTRHDFLQLTAAAVLGGTVLLLTGCGKNYEKLIVGKWYREGSSDLQFTIYDDHTCKIENSYGLGSWSITNKDQFTLSDFYGETEIMTIISIDEDSVTFGPPNAEKDTKDTVKFWHNSTSAMKGKAVRVSIGGLTDQ